MGAPEATPAYPLQLLSQSILGSLAWALEELFLSLVIIQQ